MIPVALLNEVERFLGDCSIQFEKPLMNLEVVACQRVGLGKPYRQNCTEVVRRLGSPVDAPQQTGTLVSLALAAKEGRLDQTKTHKASASWLMSVEPIHIGRFAPVQLTAGLKYHEGQWELTWLRPNRAGKINRGF